uniref:Uncharacterized protein n=1 Tax=Plectus sambesii TaxID=2011161 RepID=A0A914UMW3_9BILA
MVTGHGPQTLAASLGVASQTLSDRKMFEKLFTNLGEIQDHFKAEFLLDGAIDLLESQCHQFAADLKAFVPNATVIPKLHFLTTRIPQFARTHKTLGLLSEQALESLHARINAVVSF